MTTGSAARARNPLRSDGLFYCSACGIELVSELGRNCGCAERRAILPRARCGVCGMPAVMFFVHGFRCRAHEFQRDPSDAVVLDDVIIVVSSLGDSAEPGCSHSGH